MPQVPANLAVLVLSPGALTETDDASLMRWLTKGDYIEAAPDDVINRLARLFGQSVEENPGRAALRAWGESSKCPDAWLAAADPVHLEAHLDHLRLHALSRGEVAGDLAEIVLELNDALAGEPGYGEFVASSGLGYLRAPAERCLTGQRSPDQIDTEEPSRHMPEGPGAESFQLVQSEIQMVLHQSPVNLRREAAGLRTINGLWLWGGGRVPEAKERPLPPVFGEDPLIRGFWYFAKAEAFSWPGSLTSCLDKSSSFVAVVPPGEPASPHMAEARRLLSRGHLECVVLLCADGAEIKLRRSHRYRFWRGRRSLQMTNRGSR